VNQPSPAVVLTATTRFSQQAPQPSSSNSNSGGGGTGTTPRSTAVTESVAAAMATAGSSSPVPRQLHRQLVPGHRFITRGRAPSTSGPAHVLHWRRFPSLVLSSRPSSPSSSHLRHLLLHRLWGPANGLRPGSTTPWPACPPRTPSRWPLCSARRCYSSPRPTSDTSTQVLLPT
jgi:hypothetical protein